MAAAAWLATSWRISSSSFGEGLCRLARHLEQPEELLAGEQRRRYPAHDFSGFCVGRRSRAASLARPCERRQTMTGGSPRRRVVAQWRPGKSERRPDLQPLDDLAHVKRRRQRLAEVDEVHEALVASLGGSVLASVVDGDGGVLAERPHELDLLCGEVTLPVELCDLQQADRRPLDQQWHTQQGLLSPLRHGGACGRRKVIVGEVLLDDHAAFEDSRSSGKSSNANTVPSS